MMDKTRTMRRMTARLIAGLAAALLLILVLGTSQHAEHTTGRTPHAAAIALSQGTASSESTVPDGGPPWT